eukprot:m.708872 g.708872  ORF g.708872 m.708872 type:complete len:103 (+) comp58749_c0_seq10:1385-1693(+)
MLVSISLDLLLIMLACIHIVIIQELVDQPNWREGNCVLLIWRNLDARPSATRAATHDIELVVTYKGNVLHPCLHLDLLSNSTGFAIQTCWIPPSLERPRRPR